jgi:S1-C subfamily serine protease
MNSRKILSAVALGCLAALVVAAQQPSTTLPSPAELDKMNFEAVAAPDVSGEPSYADWQAAIRSFQTFRLGSASAGQWHEPPHRRGPSDTRIYHQAVSAVVYIFGVEEIENGEIKSGASGAGTILSTGEILTAWHVVQGAADSGNPILVFLKPPDQTVPQKDLAFQAVVTARSPGKDLALLEFSEKPRQIPAGLRVGNFAKLDVGQDIHVIGHPQDNDWSYTTGVISQIRHDFRGNMQEGKVVQPVAADVIQLQTSVNPGNSGGPVLDDNANIIGVVSFTPPAQPENIHYAIAANEIAAFLQNREQGEVNRTRGGGAPVAPQAQPHYSRAKTADGREIMKIQYADRAMYLVLGSDGKLLGGVSDAGNGVSLQALPHGGAGGSPLWRAQFPDGTVVEAIGKDGQLERFTVK